MPLTASLGMYDGPGARAANDALWDMIAGRLTARGVAGVPAKLDRARPLETIWSDPDLLLAQTCGYPLVTRYRERLRYLATPCYTAAGCDGAACRSRLVVRADDRAATLAALRGRRAAVNDRQSNSGMNLFRAAVAPLAGAKRFFGAVIETGSHADSLRAVAADEADVAAIDAVSFAHVMRDAPALAAQVRTIGWTDTAPGLPFVTSITTPATLVDALRRVIAEVFRRTESRAVREALLITGVKCLPPRAYEKMLRIETRAARFQYPKLA